jgi:hypothetical protein
MSAIRKRKTSKGKFQRDLIERHGFDNLSVATHREEKDVDDFGAPIYQKMTLYYVWDVHCATWMSGEGWEFEVTQESIDRENAILNGIIVIENNV